MTPRAAAAPRNLGIDCLRGLSIVLVVMHHTGLRIPLKSGALASFVPRRLLDGLLYNGYEAVFIFFVISGFLIAQSALGRWGGLDKIDLRAFYVRRAARILPCLFLLVAILSALALLGAKGYVIEHEGQSLPRAALAALGLHLNWYEGRTGYLPAGWDVLWSLSIEEVFYIGFPIVCMILRRGWLLVPALLALALSLPMTRAALAGNEIWQEKAYLPGMAAIAAGVLGALFVARFRSPRSAIVISTGSIGAAGIFSVLFLEDFIWQVLGNGTVLFETACTTCLVVAFHWRQATGSPKPLLGTGLLRSFGRLSYEVYLTHMFVVLAVVRVFKARGGDLRYGFIWYLPALALSWVLGALVARFISTPCERAIRGRFLELRKASAQP